MPPVMIGPALVAAGAAGAAGAGAGGGGGAAGAAGGTAGGTVGGGAACARARFGPVGANRHSDNAPAQSSAKVNLLRKVRPKTDRGLERPSILVSLMANSHDPHPCAGLCQAPCPTRSL